MLARSKHRFPDEQISQDEGKRNPKGHIQVRINSDKPSIRK